MKGTAGRTRAWSYRPADTARAACSHPNARCRSSFPNADPFEVVFVGAGDEGANEVSGFGTLGPFHAHEAVDVRRIGGAAADRDRLLHFVDEDIDPAADPALQARAADPRLHRHESRATLF